jgi:hypothetical protein
MWAKRGSRGGRRRRGDGRLNDRQGNEARRIGGGKMSSSESGRRANVGGEGAEHGDRGREEGSGSQGGAAESNRGENREGGTDRGVAARKRISKSIAWDTSMPLEPAEGDREETGTAAEKGPDSKDSVGIGGRSFPGGEDQESVLAVGEDGDALELAGRVALEEDLQAEAYGVDLAEVVGARTKGSTHLDALVRIGEEDNDAGASGARVRGGGTVCVADNGRGVEGLEVGPVGGPSVKRRGRGPLAGALSVLEDRVGELCHPLDPPLSAAVRGGGADWDTKTPDSEVEREDSSSIGDLRGSNRGEGEERVGKGKGVRGRDSKARKEKGTSYINDTAGTINMRDGVLAWRAKEAGGNVMESDLTLMTHAAKGRESVVNKGNVMENESGGDAFALLEGGDDEGEGTSSCIKVAGRRSPRVGMSGPRV